MRCHIFFSRQVLKKRLKRNQSKAIWLKYSNRFASTVSSQGGVVRKGEGWGGLCFLLWKWYQPKKGVDSFFLNTIVREMKKTIIQNQISNHGSWAAPGSLITRPTEKTAPHFELMKEKNKSFEHFSVEVLLKISKFSFTPDQSQVCVSNGLGARA